MLVAFAASAQTDCGYQPDVETDGAIGVSDVLAILGLFGSVDSDLDGIWDNNDDCIDPEACNSWESFTYLAWFLICLVLCGIGYFFYRRNASKHGSRIR